MVHCEVPSSLLLFSGTKHVTAWGSTAVTVTLRPNRISGRSAHKHSLYKNRFSNGFNSQLEKNWVFRTNSIFMIPLSLPPLNFWYFKHRLFVPSDLEWDCKVIGFRKSEFVAKTEFLYRECSRKMKTYSAGRELMDKLLDLWTFLAAQMRYPAS